MALAIASGALIMLLSVNSACLQKSIHARQARALDQWCESALDRWLLGDRKSSRGDFEGMHGWRWDIRVDQQGAFELNGVRRVTLTAHTPDQPFKAAHTLVCWDYQGKGEQP
ncbi:MAG: hypothetical protein L6R28_25800 [Planctomycetes bacterium]|nr:hypothetical protein [Planctomycetota bacterium]